MELMKTKTNKYGWTPQGRRGRNDNVEVTLS